MSEETPKNHDGELESYRAERVFAAMVNVVVCL